MKAKKVALSGMVILICVLALCMFFSGTIRTIATAKVKIAVPRKARFTQTIELASKLTFTTRTDVPLDVSPEMTVTIKSVRGKVGQQVKKGDVIFSGGVTNYAQTMAQYRSDFNALEEQSLALERKDIRLRRTEQTWADAYEAYTDTHSAYTQARLDFDAELQLNNMQLADGEPLPDDAPDSVKAVYEAREKAEAAWDAARKRLDSASRSTITEEVRNYVIERKKLKDQLAEAEEQMIDLRVSNERVRQVKAPQDGFVVEIYGASGDTIVGGEPAFAICPKKEMPVLRASLKDVTITITNGMDATFKDRRDSDVESEVIALGVELDGTKYADIELDSDMLEDLGGSYMASQADIPVKILYRARQSTTLLPTSAVRGSGKERYVFVLERQTGAFGAIDLVVVKTNVTVLAESAGVTSVSEDMSNQQIAYMEDRPIDDKSKVMAYPE